MKRLTLLCVLAACGGGGGSPNNQMFDAPVNDARNIDAPIHDATTHHDGPSGDGGGTLPDGGIIIIFDGGFNPDGGVGLCNVLAQTGCNVGEKCTWLVDQYTPQYIGHIGCAPAGGAAVDAACQFGAAGVTGYDNCKPGAVCSNYQGGAGVCRAICDDQGGMPACNSTHGCVDENGLFGTGGFAAAGVCDPSCDPLADNDFDGPGSAHTRSSSACGSASTGCYGYPSSSGVPTTFTCQADLHYTTPLHHRTVCNTADGCEDSSGTLYVNSCNQGYLPLLEESTGSTNVVCTALCKPTNCYAGNCGSADVNRHGVASHRCQTPDALGTFDTTANGEECAYWWYLEEDGSGGIAHSPYSDTVGFCFDHNKYEYDLGSGTMKPFPSCQQLQIHGTGSDPTMPLTYFGAADFACVDSATAGLFTGKRTPPKALGVRALYHPVMH
jgi:hypothetical protein